jgi:hypothetical protein
LLKKRPKKILYHATEFISLKNPRRMRAHRALLDDVDLMTCPEVDRYIIDTETIGAKPKRMAPILNCADVSSPDSIQRNPANARNGHFLFYGTLHRAHAFADYFWHPDVAKYPLDIFGRITDPQPQAVMEGLQSNANCRYFGVLPPQRLNSLRRHCSWSLVWWNPGVSPAAYYLCSNRFFSSIQAGVPPICGPHPQCVEFIRRYDCGLVMKDWSVESLAAAMEQATAILQTPRYAELVANCMIAAEELNWDAQFERAKPAILECLAA